MWICNIGGGILGYAQFPGGAASTDGVVMGPQYFGSSAKGSGFYLASPFDLGRTTTHEVGHFLNLRHIWGDGGCSVDDFVSDTPTSDGPNYGCATGTVSCGTTDMVQNYMDYSNDSCMNLYTAGQKARMRAVLDPGGVRRSLALSDKCGGAPVGPTCNDGVQNGNETGIDCGGDCEPCQSACSDNEVTLTIVYDNYPTETSWSLSGNGANFTSSAASGTSLTEVFCLTDGCYTFTINDSYGDGICCAYGNGSYTITGADGVLVSGGDFGTTESTDFCLGGDPVPTCTDGVQNGDETGIDCGGSCTPCQTNDTVFVEGSFETGLEGWTDGGSDCARVNNASRASDGSFSVRIRDNSGAASSMTSPSFDVTGFSGLNIQFGFYANSMEAGEDFFVRFIDGTTITTVATFARGTDFDNNTFYTVDFTVPNTDVNFTNNSSIRIQCDASGNQDQIYVDQVRLTGVNGAGNRAKPSLIAQSTVRIEEVADYLIYPTLVDNRITVTTNYDGLKPTYAIYDMNGRMVQKGAYTTDEIKVSTLEAGVYIIQF
jgi:hypothetical protein